MRMRVVFAMLLFIGACSPAGEPLSRDFAGWWRPEAGKLGCERAAMRFERNQVHVRRDARLVTVFEITEAKLAPGEARLTLRIADEAALLAAIDQGRPAMATELPKRAIVLTLRRAGDRLVPNNALIQESGPRGLRAPGRGEARAITQIFTMTPCPA